MAMTAAVSFHSLFLSFKSGIIRPARQPELAAVQPAERGGRRRRAARPAKAMEAQRNWEWSRGAAAATESENVMMRCEELGKEMENASPLAIVDKALEMFGNDIAIAFSGAEDVALLEYARLTGRPFRVFSLDTGRLHPETYQFLDVVEKHYGVHIEYMFPDSGEVQALVRSKGLFSFYEDGHHECCMVRKVRPLRRALKGFKAWITGQRRDQLLDTASSIPIVQVDPSFEGLDGGEGSLIKWNPFANIEGKDIWNFLRAMEVPVNTLHSQGFVSIGCEPCTRPVLPNQRETEGSWWWEDTKTKECGFRSANTSQNNSRSCNNTINGVNDIPDIFESHAIVSLTRLGIMNLLKLEKRKEPWLVVLYAPWCRFCQAMESSYVELAEKLNGSGVKVGKFRSDGDQKTFAKLELQLGSFPTIIFFPNHASRPVKYSSKRWDVDSFLNFVNAFR